jgi:hypothetical protein
MYLKKHVFFHKLLIFALSVFMILTLTSCTQQKKPVPKATKSEEEQNKPPKELDELSKAVEKIEKTLVEMHERSKIPLFLQQEEIKKQEEKKKEQGEQQGGSGSEQGGGGQQGGKGQQSSQVELVTPQAKQAEPQLEVQQMKIEVEKANATQLEELKKGVIELHGLWNAFEAKAVSQFVMQSSIVDFEDALNNLTKSLDSGNIFQSLLDVTQLYKFLPDFYMTYASDYPPEIDKIRFAVKKTQLLGEKKNYEAAKETLNYLTGIWMLTRPKLNKESQDMVNQIEFALSDLNKAIESKNDIIIKPKTEVILKVADELEKKNSKKEQKK